MSLDRGCDTDAMNEYRQVRIDSRQLAVVAEPFIGDIDRIVFEMRTTSTPCSRARSVTSARAALPPPEKEAVSHIRHGTWMDCDAAWNRASALLDRFLIELAKAQQAKEK